MNIEPKGILGESYAYISGRSFNNHDDKPYKGKREDLKCQHCHNIGHSIN